MKRFIIIGVGLLFLVGVVAQGEAEELRKVGYINLGKLFDEYEKTEEADKVLEEKGNARQTEREKKFDEVKRLKDKIALMSAEEKEKKQEALDEKAKELEDFDRQTQVDLRRERDTMVREILKEIDKVIQEYGEKNGYDLILNDRVLLYGAGGLDLTDEILKVLNESYKNK